MKHPSNKNSGKGFGWWLGRILMLGLPIALLIAFYGWRSYESSQRRQAREYASYIYDTSSSGSSERESSSTASYGDDDSSSGFYVRTPGELRGKAMNGDSRAQYLLYLAYLRGEVGFMKDKEMALKYLRQSAEGGCARAMTMLGVHYELGELSLPKDQSEAERLYVQAYEADDAYAGYQLLRLREAGKLYQEVYGLPSVYDLKSMANSGDARAMYLLSLGIMGGVIDPESTGSEEWMERAANKGDAEAMFEYGYILSQRSGKSSDPELSGQVKKLYLAASEGGSLPAEYALIRDKYVRARY